MSETDPPKPLPDTWVSIRTLHLVAFNKLYDIISKEGVSLNQAVQRRESDVSAVLSGSSGSYSLDILVDPIGVEVSYVRMPAESRIADDGATLTRIDERLTVRYGGEGC
jgi:hypothetical protein